MFFLCINKLVRLQFEMYRRKTKPDNILHFADYCQEYAYVMRMLGNCRCEVYCFDGIKRLAHIRGKMKNTVWVNALDYVLVGLREFQDEKCDIIHKYSDEEVRSLKCYNELPQMADTLQKTEEECNFDFDDI